MRDSIYRAESTCLFSIPKATVLPFSIHGGLMLYYVSVGKAPKRWSVFARDDYLPLLSVNTKPVQFFFRFFFSPNAAVYSLLAPFTSTTFRVALLYCSTRFPRDQLEPSDDRHVPAKHVSMHLNSLFFSFFCCFLTFIDLLMVVETW